MGIEKYYNLANMHPDWYKKYTVSRTIYNDGSCRYYYFKEGQYMFTEEGREEYFPQDYDYKSHSGIYLTMWDKCRRAEDNAERSVRRSRRLLKDYILNNHNEKQAYFVTLTNKAQSIDFKQFYGDLKLIDVPSEITMCWANDELIKEDNAEYKKKVLKKLNHLRTRYPDFQYILIPEFHKTGYIHLHGFFFNFPDDLMKDTGIKHKGKKVFNIKGFENLGHTQCTIIRKISKASTYATKYVTKEMTSYKGWQRYYISSGIKKPVIEKVEMTMDDFFGYCEWFKDCGNGWVGFCSPLPF